MESIQKLLSSLEDNANASATLGLFLVLYAGLAAPKLPKSIALLFDNSVFKLVIIFLIAFMSSKNSSVAIIATVSLVVSLQTLSMYQTNDIILDAVKDKEVVKIESSEESYSEESHSEEEIISEENIEPEGYVSEEMGFDVAEESVAEESVAGESIAEESVAGESVAEESIVEESVAEESVAEESVAEESVEEPRSKAQKLVNVIGWSNENFAKW